MERLFSIFGSPIDPLQHSCSDDADYLSSCITVFALLIISLLMMSRYFITGEPIACWCPSHFTRSHLEYTNKVGHMVCCVTQLF